MTLLEMAGEYRRSCALIQERMGLLRRSLRTEEDLLAAQQLRQRLAELSALYREGREIALHLEHYYDRRYHTHGKFSF